MDTPIAVIILNYRTARLTIECLKSMENEIDDGVLVFIVDNNSADGSCEEIEDSIKRNNWGGWCRLIASSINDGFAAGMNKGIRSVKAEAYVLLNSDTIIRPGAITILHQALEQNPGVGLVAPALENIAGEVEQNTFRNMTPVFELMRSAETRQITSLLRKFDVVIKPGSKPFEPEWVGFACVVIHKHVINEVGLLDEEFFMYFEDIDYCRRVREKGWKILYWPEARVVHLIGRSSGITKTSSLRSRAPKYYYESRAYYFKKYYGIYGFIAANIFWTSGRCVSFLREKIGNKVPTLRQYESRDIWNGLMAQSSRYKRPQNMDK